MKPFRPSFFPQSVYQSVCVLIIPLTSLFIFPCKFLFLFMFISSYSSNYFLFHLQVGPSGSIFGIIACLFVELLQSWQIIARPFTALFKLCGSFASLNNRPTALRRQLCPHDWFLVWASAGFYFPSVCVVRPVWPKAKADPDNREFSIGHYVVRGRIFGVLHQSGLRLQWLWVLELHSLHQRFLQARRTESTAKSTVERCGITVRKVYR